MNSTGGFVYPHEWKRNELDKAVVYSHGITRRDWLIGEIIKGLVSNPQVMSIGLYNDIADGVRGGEPIVKCAEYLADKTIERSLT